MKGKKLFDHPELTDAERLEDMRAMRGDLSRIEDLISLYAGMCSDPQARAQLAAASLSLLRGLRHFDVALTHLHER